MTLPAEAILIGTPPKKKRRATSADVLSLASGSTTPTENSASTRSRRRSSASPSKPKASKPPCKYGPRDADGRCPRKPPSGRQTRANRTKVTARSGDAAVRQGIEVLTNPRATTEQKSRAVETVGTNIATDAVRKTVRKQAPKIQAAIKKYGPDIVTAAAPIAAAVLGGKTVSSLQGKRIKKQSQKMLDDTIKRTPKAQRGQYTAEVKKALLAQYEQHIRRQNDILFTK